MHRQNYWIFQPSVISLLQRSTEDRHPLLIGGDCGGTMIRILHVVGKMHRGGMETMIMNYYRHLDRNQIQFDFLTHYQAEGAFDREIEQLGGRIFRLSVLEDKNPIRYLLELASFFRTHNEYKIVHGHLTSLGAFYMPIAKRAGVRIRIAHAHTNSHVKGLKGKLTFLLQLPLRHLANRFFACSEGALAWLLGNNIIDWQRTVILKNAIDVNAYRFNPVLRTRVRDRLNLGNKLIVGHVGAMSPLKNHVFLLESFYCLSQEVSDAMLILVGDGSLREQIMQQAQALGLTKRVLFLGERDDVNELLQAFDLFLFPSLSEGLGIALVEAQAAGLPCFAATVMPQEVRVTPLLHCIPLEQGAEAWAQEMVTYTVSKGEVRPDLCEDIIRQGFDISVQASWLADYYISQYEQEYAI